jgi:NAD(P)-dependent dehydrogenase (short-subunit alcohol dehydrogenase family)
MHVLVTGAANGIGAAVCRRFASEGHRVTAVDQMADALERLSDDITRKGGIVAGILSGDLADETFAEQVVPDTWSRWGPVDVAVMAAGVYPAIHFLQLTSKAWDRVQAVNVRSVMQLTRSLAELAIANGRVASVNPLGRRGRPEDISAAVYWLASAEASWVNGAVLRVDGGASAGTIALPMHWPDQTELQIPPASDGVESHDE